MQEIFQKIPLGSLEYVKGLLNNQNILIKLKNNRKTKHGDFSVKKDFSVEITINSDMNPFRFLITLLHEISHFFVYQDFGFKTKPHGFQWKSKFKELLIPVINNKVFPDDILSPLAKYAINPKASTDTDLDLSIALNKYNVSISTYVLDLEQGDKFKASNKKNYLVIRKRRKRYECMEIDSKKIYLFSPNYKIIKITNEK
jgi:Zn-dependent peptidase ImmA (M78 family)